MIANKEYLTGYSTFKYPIKGPKNRPLTTTDDVAVQILVDSEDDYAGYVSLTDILSTLISENEDLKARLQKLENTDFTTEDVEDSSDFENI